MNNSKCHFFFFFFSLKGRHFYLMIVEAGKSKIKMLADLMSGENLLPGFHNVVFLIYPHMKERKISLSKYLQYTR